MPAQEAWHVAQSRGHFLLEVQQAAQPPVWKLVVELPTAPASAAAEEVGPRSGPMYERLQTRRPPNKEARVKEVWPLQSAPPYHSERPPPSTAACHHNHPAATLTHNHHEPLSHCPSSYLSQREPARPRHAVSATGQVPGQ